MRVSPFAAVLFPRRTVRLKLVAGAVACTGFLALHWWMLGFDAFVVAFAASFNAFMAGHFFGIWCDQRRLSVTAEQDSGESEK